MHELVIIDSLLVITPTQPHKKPTIKDEMPKRDDLIGVEARIQHRSGGLTDCALIPDDHRINWFKNQNRKQLQAAR